MQFILPRAIQCSSGTTGPGSAPRRPPKHQPYLNPFSHPRQSPGPSAAAGCAGGDVQCLGPSWAPTPPVGGEGLQPSPSPAAALQGEGVSPALGQLGAQLCPGSLPDRGTGEIHLPAPASLILILWAQQELRAHLCLQHTPSIGKSEWGHEGSCPGQSHAEPPGEGP